MITKTQALTTRANGYTVVIMQDTGMIYNYVATIVYPTGAIAFKYADNLQWFQHELSSHVGVNLKWEMVTRP